MRRVVFAMHGIWNLRDGTREVSRRAKARAHASRETRATNTLSYGCLPMQLLVFPRNRRSKAGRLGDKYTEVPARYPDASLSIAWHGDGTDLLARALGSYVASTFKQVVLAGNDVRSSHDWNGFLECDKPCVGAAPNVVTMTDRVVAHFSLALRTPPPRQCGSRLVRRGFALSPARRELSMRRAPCGRRRADMRPDCRRRRRRNGPLAHEPPAGTPTHDFARAARMRRSAGLASSRVRVWRRGSPPDPSRKPHRTILQVLAASLRWCSRWNSGICSRDCGGRGR